MKMIMSASVTGLILTLLGLPSLLFATEAYPNKAIRLVVPVPPGAGLDANSRLVAAKLTELLQQQVIVDNHPGANTTIAAQLLAKSRPDGYTLMMAANTTLVSNPAVYRKLPYDVERDFALISLIEILPVGVVVHPSVPAKTVGELINLANQNPDKLIFGSQGIASGTHIWGEMFKLAAGVRMRHIPFALQSPYPDLIGGHLTAVFDTFSPVLPNHKAGKLRVLAISGRERRPQAPDVPTFTEAGLPKFEAYAFYGPVAPAHTPASVISQLHDAMAAATKTPAFIEKLTSVSAGYVLGTTPEEFAARIKAEREKTDEVVKQARIELEL